MKKLVVLCVLAITALLLVNVMAGCQQASGIIAKAHAATMDLQSYRTTSSISSTFEGQTSELTYETEFVAPDRYRGKATTNGDWVEFIIIGDKKYIRDSDPSCTTSVGVVGSSLSEEDTLELLDSLTDLEELPGENIDGVDCLRYWGRVDIDRMVDEWKAELDPAQPGYEERLKVMERQRQMKTEVELWIGKDDYLIRQMKYEMQVPSEVVGQWDTSSSMMKYYDFNEPITIEPPLDAYGELLPGWELAGNTSGETHFYTELNSEITGEDPAHSQISISVTITNVGMEAMAGNVRVKLRNSAVIGDNGEAGWINAEPLTSEPVNLEPGESAVYSASWGYDASHITRDELTEQLERTVIRIAYITPEGNEATRMYSAGGAPYPTAVPPEGPPG